MGKSLLLCRWLVIALEVTAMTTVAEIPVHVAQKRIKALSPCSDIAPQSMSVAPGNVLGHSLSLW